MKQKAVRYPSALAAAAALSVASGTAHAEGVALPNKFWRPDQLDLSPLRQSGVESNPLGGSFASTRSIAGLITPTSTRRAASSGR